MHVLLIGSGGREHALAWKIVQSPRVSRLTCLPGNPGMSELGEQIEGVAPTDAGAIAAVAKAQGVDLVVVGPEAPLAAGVVDALQRAGVPAFGPSRAAAQLESSKAFAKAVMDEAGVATAGWAAFEEEIPALDYLRSRPGPYVVKADGLAAGKGVLVTNELAAAERWVSDCTRGKFGEAGRRIVVEAYLAGPEVSVFAVCDGRDAVILQPARDYKRLGDGGAGPNTGGMGSFCPVSDLPDDLAGFTLERVVRPVLAAMADRGHPFVGFLYTGYVLTAEGPLVLEFNCRLGDPETQVVLPLMRTDLVELLTSALSKELAGYEIEYEPGSAVNVVLASAGYPESPRRGDIIRGTDKAAEQALVFHAGTARDDRGRLVTSGGRVLNVVGLGAGLESATRNAYRAVEQISWHGMQYRTDIAGAS